MRMPKIVLCFLLLLFSASVKSTALTEENLQQWIKAFPAFNDWMNKNRQKVAADFQLVNRKDTSDERLKENFVEIFKRRELYDEANKLVKPFGFEQPEQVYVLTSKIRRTLSAIEYLPEEDKIRKTVSKLEEKIQAIKKDESLSWFERYKKLGNYSDPLDKYQAALTLIEEGKQGNIDIVQPYFDKVSQLLKH